MSQKLRIVIAASIVCAFVTGVAVLTLKKHPRDGQTQELHSTGTVSSPKSGSHEAEQEAKQEKTGRKTTDTMAQKNAAQPGNPETSVAAVATATALQPSCFIETFHHKPLPGHSDEEACSRHRNLLKLAHSSINPAHVCVRVNGTPVKFDRKGDEILIGSIAGPHAKITVSYSTGKSTCAELAKQDCTIPKDEFMEALGGDTDSAAQWDSGDSAQGSDNAKLNAEVKKELAEIDDANPSENDRAPAQAAIFKDWIRDDERPL